MEQFGLDLTNHKKQKKYQLLNNIVQNYGLVIENKHINFYTNRIDLSQAIHDYVLAISEISYLGILKKENIKSLFKDEVMQYFLSNRKIYPNIFPEFKVEGKSKLIHSFEAVFPGEATEYVKTIKRIDKNNAKMSFSIGMMLKYIEIKILILMLDLISLQNNKMILAKQYQLCYLNIM